MLLCCLPSEASTPNPLSEHYPCDVVNPALADCCSAAPSGRPATEQQDACDSPSERIWLLKCFSGNTGGEDSFVSMCVQHPARFHGLPAALCYQQAQSVSAQHIPLGLCPCSWMSSFQKGASWRGSCPVCRARSRAMLSDCGSADAGLVSAC